MLRTLCDLRPQHILDLSYMASVTPSPEAVLAIRPGRPWPNSCLAYPNGAGHPHDLHVHHSCCPTQICLAFDWRLAYTQMKIPRTAPGPHQPENPPGRPRAWRISQWRSPYTNSLYVANIPSSFDRREQLSRNFFKSVLKPTSCLFYTLPPERDASVRTAQIFPRIPTRTGTNEYVQVIYFLYALSYFQSK